MVSRREYQQAYRRTHKRTAESAAWRVSHPEAAKAKAKKHAEARTNRERIRKVQQFTFIGVDGEGWDIDGSHEYTMMVTSLPKQYLSPGRALTTLECLDFLTSLPHKSRQLYVSYYFDYDVTMILRDMARDDADKCRQLFEPGSRKYVWWNGYGIKYRPHKSFHIKRWSDNGKTQPTVIHDISSFFQSAFVTALRKYKIGTPEALERMADMKAKRNAFTPAEVDSILEYSQQECAYMVELAEHIRDISAKVQLSPYPFEGPGGLAGNAYARYYGKPKHLAALAKMPARFEELMLWVMYGGRFETLAVGEVDTHVTEWDLSSAYPWALTQLPCLIHGRWVYSKRRHEQWAISHIDFRMDGGNEFGQANPLPIRRPTGELFYPATGTGWYWRHEYEHAGLDRTVNATWSWVPGGCDCRHFDWVRNIYNERKEMEAESKGSGIALKLALNTLYGKMAQRNPVPGAWLNMVYASMVTSLVRRRMYDAYLKAGCGNVIMFATDAIFTVNGAEVDSGIGLGQFERAYDYPSLVLIQPGVYYSRDEAHFKTRGIPKRIIIAHSKRIKDCAAIGIDYPVEVVNFNGLRLSLARKSLTKLGQWTTDLRIISTRPVSKRAGEWRDNNVTWTRPRENTFGDSYPLDDHSAVVMQSHIGDMEADGMIEDWAEN